VSGSRRRPDALGGDNNGNSMIYFPFPTPGLGQDRMKERLKEKVASWHIDAWEAYLPLLILVK
jgi:hypothetical protein